MVLVGFKPDLWRLTGFLQCFDTVGLVILPVKIVPEMTYNVLSRRLSLSTTITSDYAGFPWGRLVYTVSGPEFEDPHGERGTRTYNGGLGQSPSGIRGRFPGQGIRGRHPLKVNVCCICTTQKIDQFVLKSVFLQNKKIRRTFGGMAPWPSRSTSGLGKPLELSE